VPVADPQPAPEPVAVPASDPQPARIPASASPADGTPRVNINSASAEELTTLPGIGRRAAERIIDWREEYGDFESLEDLGQVEGFGPDRIRRLTGHAEV
jgi:competence protein ComEA